MTQKRIYRVLLLFMLFSSGFSQQSVNPPKFGGSQKCKLCHGSQAGNQFGIWEKSAHRKAFQTLETDQARTIGNRMGISDPRQDKRCLQCHATSLEKDRYEDKFPVGEGVGCEGCHGAGSEYRQMAAMLVKNVAIQKGLLIPTRTDCVRCHTPENNPTFRGFDYPTYWNKIKHPLVKKK